MAHPRTDLVDDVLTHILPRYREPAFELPTDYDQDVRRIVKAYHAASTERRKELVALLSMAKWAAIKYPRSNRTILMMPWGHYVPNKKLQQLLDGLIAFIDPCRSVLCSAKAREVLEACGAPSRLARDLGATLSDDELSGIRCEVGWKTGEGEIVDDYSIWVLDQILRSIAEGVPRWRDRSWALWDCLHDALRHRGEDFFWGRYEAWDVRSKRKMRAARFPARFVRQLQQAAWLPGGKNKPQRPCELSLAELPAKFRRGASPLLVHVLGFKTDAAGQADDNHIIALEILEVGKARPTAKSVKAAEQKKTSARTRKKRARR